MDTEVGMDLIVVGYVLALGMLLESILLILSIGSLKQRWELINEEDKISEIENN